MSKVLEVVSDLIQKETWPQGGTWYAGKAKIRLGKRTLLWNEHRGRKGIGIIPRKAF